MIIMYTELNNNKVQTEKSSPCKIIIFFTSLLFVLIIKLQLSKEVRKRIKTIDCYINFTRVEIGTIQNSYEKNVINQ